MNAEVTHGDSWVEANQDPSDIHSSVGGIGIDMTEDTVRSKYGKSDILQPKTDSRGRVWKGYRPLTKGLLHVWFPHLQQPLSYIHPPFR